MTKADERLASQIALYKIGERTDSAAQLAWFLETAWRLDPSEVEDAICDGYGDKGIDAIVVDNDLAEIVILQGKWIVNPSKKTVGDSALKSLVASADYFKSADTVQGLIDSKPNKELLQLLHRQKVKDLVTAGGHVVRLVLVTNGALDDSAKSYLAARASLEPYLDAWDRARMTAVALRTERPELRAETVTLRATARPTEVTLSASERMAVAVVPATELVKMPGISDLTLFSRNVRLFIGRSKINENLRETVDNPNEHSLFPAYHNGLTILTDELSVRGKTLKLKGAGVVNGCQSLSTLYDRKDNLTDALQVLVKIVEVGSDGELSDLITYRSNNQNAVTLRDQRSNDKVMRDLQRAVKEEYGTSFALSVRAGEKSGASDILDNAFAAQLLMAVYLEEPWAAVRKVRLFDQEYRRIFNRAVTAHRLRLLFLLDRAVTGARPGLRADLRSSFASVRFTIAYLVSQVCALSEPGRLLFEDPGKWLPSKEAQVLEALKNIANEVVESVNFYIESELAEIDDRREAGEEDVEDLDPKTVFKSQRGVKELEHEALRNARRDAKRSSYLFSVSPTPRKRATKKR